MTRPVMAAWRWGKRSPTCLWCGAEVPQSRRRYCTNRCAEASHRADRTDLLRAIHRAIRQGQLSWDGSKLGIHPLPPKTRSKRA